MSERFCYSVATELARDRVWQIFADITNWRRVPGIYDDLKWAGEPWLPGSRIVGEHNHPAAIKFHYVIKSCAPPESVRFIAHGVETGFATERTISFECLDARTRIKVDSYTVGEPTIQLPDGVRGFIRDVTVRFWDAFAHFCDAQLFPRFRMGLSFGTNPSCGMTRPKSGSAQGAGGPPITLPERMLNTNWTCLSADYPAWGLLCHLRSFYRIVRRHLSG